MDISPRIITAGASEGELSGNHFGWLWLSALRSCLNKQMVNQQMSKELRRDQKCLSVHRSPALLILTSFCIKKHRFCILFNDFFFKAAISDCEQNVSIHKWFSDHPVTGKLALSEHEQRVLLQVFPRHDLNQPLQVASLECCKSAKNTQSTHTREIEACTWTMVTCTD